MMEVGELVRLVKIPDHLPDDEVKELEFCLGRVFPILEIDEFGLVVFDITQALGLGEDRYVSISIMPEFLEPVL